MKIGSLFSGAGGLDLAVEAVTGGRTVWHCETDPAASKVLAARWPDVPNLGNVTAVDWSTVEPVDVLCGGFPCQDVSTAAVDRRRGLASGTRSNLWANFAVAVDALRPAIVLIENVRGLLSAAAHRSMESGSAAMGNKSGRPVLRAAGAVLGDLASIGYDAQWTTISADSVGAPHKRARVFILAAPRTGDRAVITATMKATQPAEPGQTPRGHRLLPTPTCQDAANVAGTSQFRRHTLPLNVVATLLPTPSASDGIGGGPNDPANRLSGGHQVQMVDLGMRSTPDIWGRYEAAVHRWEQLTRVAPSSTEASARGKFGARLNPAFSEWMMGWPAGWCTDPALGISRNEQLRIIGNGVVPQQAIAALRQLLAIREAVG